MLTFEPGPHRYTLDGRHVPSVTQILKSAGLIDFDHVPIYTLAVAMERGRHVHAAIHFYNERDLDVARFEREFPECAGYLRGWISFCEQRRFVPVLNEHRIASRALRVAGTADCFGVLDGEAVLLDFATGRPEDVAKDLQTAAYLGLALEWAADPDADDHALQVFLDEHRSVARCGVALRRDATFTIERYADPADFRHFLTLVDAHRIVAARKGERVNV